MRWEDRLLVHMRDTALTLLFSMCVHCLHSAAQGTQVHVTTHVSHALGAARCCVVR